MKPKIDLNLLPIAVALHERRSVSRAAETLNMSQPAVSTALGKLRRALGDPLFVRTSRGMEPTPPRDGETWRFSGGAPAPSATAAC